jgi:hypothetical protein
VQEVARARPVGRTFPSPILDLELLKANRIPCMTD